MSLVFLFSFFFFGLAQVFTFFPLSRKECPKLDSEQRSRVDHILAYSQLPKNEARMAFNNIVIDSALWEHLGYQILVDKVLWDLQRNPKKSTLPSDKLGGRNSSACDPSVYEILGARGAGCHLKRNF